MTLLYQPSDRYDQRKNQKHNFELENKRLYGHILRRSRLDFFANHQEVYNSNNANVFLNKNGYELFKAYLQEKPEQLLQSIAKNIHAMIELTQE